MPCAGQKTAVRCVSTRPASRCSLPWPNKRRTRKPRKPARLHSLLSDEQKETLIGWLVTFNLTYREAVVRIERDWGIQTNGNALTLFWQTYCAPRLMLPVVDVQIPVVFNVRIAIRPGQPVDVKVEKETLP
jgi:hypothetical protein